MTTARFNFLHGSSCKVEAFLAERIHEFNENATGYNDGESFAATERVAEVHNHPVGHSNIVFSKALGDNGT